MDIFQWWLIKMVAIQSLCIMGVVWGVRCLQANRPVLEKIKKSPSVPIPPKRNAAQNFSQN